MKMNKSIKCKIVIVSLLTLLAGNVLATDALEKAPVKVLIKNVNIFNGTSKKLITGKDVVLVDNKIDKMITAGSGGNKFDTVIDGKGGYLTPGLIDAHFHATLGLEAPVMAASPASYVQAIAISELKDVLMRGVTTVRDTGGNVAGIKRAINEGYLAGPRIYASQNILSQYSGHTDFRNPNEQPKEWGGPADPMELIGIARLVNGEQQVLAAVRDNLYQGADQIKICISGGVTSFTDPLYVYEFLPEEISMAVRAAADYGTYVMAHAHSAHSIKRAVPLGVKSFEHISMADEEAIKMMAKAGAHATVSPLTPKQIMDTFPATDVRHMKAKEAWDGTDNVMKWAKKHDLHLSWGTDLLNSMELRKLQLKDLTMHTIWFSSAETMIHATGNAGATVALTGKRNPYGKLGVIEQGAMADMLIYSRNPLEDVSIIEDYENNLKVIIKDGKVYKNTL